MDEQVYLKKEIKAFQRKQNGKTLLQSGCIGIAAGGSIALLLEGSSIFVPFYTVHVYAMLCIGLGLAAGLVVAYRRRCSMHQAARKMDGFGFQERIVTAYEHLGQDGTLDQMQRADAVRMLKAHRDKINVSLRPANRSLLAMGLSIGLTLVLAWVPSPAKEQAEQTHAILQEAKEKEEQLKTVIDQLEKADTDTLTEEQKTAVQELMDALARSEEEFRQVQTKQQLAAAEQKLAYKYQQAAEYAGAQTLADAGIPAAEYDPQGGQGTDSGSDTKHSGRTGEGSDSTQSGTQTGNGTPSTEQAAATADGSPAQNGGGSESGDGSATGSGTGSQTGNGSGSGSGGGRGTGSGDRTHTYVSVPNAIGNDKSITKDKGDSDDSDYYKAKNGLAWKGEHVELDSVVAAYTKEAYEGLATGRYPAGMEDVIRSYFENLN